METVEFELVGGPFHGNYERLDPPIAPAGLSDTSLSLMKTTAHYGHIYSTEDASLGVLTFERSVRLHD